MENGLSKYNIYVQFVLITGNIILSISSIIIFCLGVYIMKLKNIKSMVYKTKRLQALYDIYTIDDACDTIGLMNNLKECLDKEADKSWTGGR
jgi:hypothetical protein